jgi:hypothetical protein
MRHNFMRFGSDITDDIVYGCRDVLILEEICHIIGYKYSVLALMDIYDCGLYTALYQTP